MYADLISLAQGPGADLDEMIAAALCRAGYTGPDPDIIGPDALARIAEDSGQSALAECLRVLCSARAYNSTRA